MTQFNLLPDIKLTYLKAERTKRFVIFVSVIVSAVAVAVTIGLFVINVLQKSQINSLSADIRLQGSKISQQKNLNNILTIQNQLRTLTKLHEQVPAVSNLATYLNETIPTAAGLNSLSIDFDTDTLTLSGSANSLATVNQLVDSLKFATYTIQGVRGSSQAFSNVVLSAFGISSKSASFTLNSSFSAALFNNTENVTLNVPSQVTTRSQVDQPVQLFNSSSTNTNGG